MLPIEKMAARLLARHQLFPPFDLEALVSNYGVLEYRAFPFNADGITVGIGGKEKPQILINSSIAPTRQKFTLAHELGHIIIPWHTGTIISHLGNNVNEHQEYRQMEMEANKFAAELLLPTDWLIAESKKFDLFESFIKTVLINSGASRDVVLIKVFKTIEWGVVCAEVDENGKRIRDYHTSSAPNTFNLYNKDLLREGVFSTASTTEKFDLGDRTYKCWIFESEAVAEFDDRSWREILRQILTETDSQNLQASINAILPSTYHRHKDKSYESICTAIVCAYDGRDRLSNVVAHPLFTQYVIKRVKELINKNTKYKR